MKVSQKELDEILDYLTGEIDNLKTSHKQEIKSIIVDYENIIYNLRVELYKLQNQPSKTIIKYVKR